MGLAPRPERYGAALGYFFGLRPTHTHLARCFRAMPAQEVRIGIAPAAPHRPRREELLRAFDNFGELGCGTPPQGCV